MRICCLCHKTIKSDKIFFKIPKNERRRRKWSKICGIHLSASGSICGDHFSSSDMIKGPHNMLLAPNAVPFVDKINDKEIVQLTNIQDIGLGKNASLEYVHINTIYAKSSQDCRCCTNPSSSFKQLDSYINPNEETENTFKDILYEITKLDIATYYENILPQQICQKCEDQLKNSFKFIQQARKVSQQYLNLINQTDIYQDDIKNMEHLRESLIELAEASNAEQVNEGLKPEPLNIEYDTEIKEENLECKKFMPTVLKNDESQENTTFLLNLNIDDHSSEDDEHSEEPESIKAFGTDLNNESIARCCDICHKVYRNEKFLKIHKRYAHMPEEDKLPCPLCCYKTSRSSALKVHMGLVHGLDKVNEYFKPVLDSDKKYPCNICPRSYVRKDSLQKHVRSNHLNKSSKKDEPKKSKILKPKEKHRFLCTYCGRSFNSKNGLESHALMHTGERPFSCEICSKTFKRLKDLQLHRVIHSDEKPHQCTECGKAFKRVDKLKFHMRVHSELRPYKCNECEKTFKYPSVLRTHMHIHTGQTPFSCKTCGEAFSLRTSLNYHCLKNGHVK